MLNLYLVALTVMVCEKSVLKLNLDRNNIKFYLNVFFIELGKLLSNFIRFVNVVYMFFSVKSISLPHVLTVNCLLCGGMKNQTDHSLLVFSSMVSISFVLRITSKDVMMTLPTLMNRNMKL